MRLKDPNIKRGLKYGISLVNIFVTPITEIPNSKVIISYVKRGDNQDILIKG